MKPPQIMTTDGESSPHTIGLCAHDSKRPVNRERLHHPLTQTPTAQPLGTRNPHADFTATNESKSLPITEGVSGGHQGDSATPYQVWQDQLCGAHLPVCHI